MGAAAARSEEDGQFSRAIRRMDDAMRVRRGVVRRGLLLRDRDGDGRLRRDEFDPADGAFFDGLDRDKDGLVTPEELDAFEWSD
jgi:hypothetical protein